MSRHHKSQAINDGADRNQAVKPPSKEKAFQSPPAVRVEFPREGDTISPPSYTFQIAAKSDTEGVEVSINHGEWQPCREALGLWWFDWSGFEKGSHEIAARTRLAGGVNTNSGPRRFKVD